jgi:hypothetical protein
VVFFLDFVLKVLKLPICRFTIMSAKTSFVIFAAVAKAGVIRSLASAVQVLGNAVKHLGRRFHALTVSLCEKVVHLDFYQQQYCCK